MPATPPAIAAPAIIKSLPSLEDVRRERCARSLAYFFAQAWPHFTPGRKLGHNWHLDAICEHVQAALENEIRKLVINVPHRHTKSSIVSIAAMAWEWGPAGRPEKQWLGVSGTRPLATRDARKTRNLILSPWYQERWGHAFKLRADQNEKVNFENNHNGTRVALSTGSGMGNNADRVSCDDPNEPDDTAADFESKAAWWDDTMSSRLNDPDDGCLIITQQRLDERDLTGHVLAQGDWVHLMLPAEFERARRCVIPVTGFKDPRTEEGEPLDPVRHGKAWIDAEKARLASYRAAGMLQQRPAPKGGGIFKRDWYRRIKRADLPEFFATLISFDTASTEDTANDQSAATVWGVSSAPHKKGFFKLSQWADWLEIPELIRKVEDYRSNWPGAVLLIENKNSGPAVIQHLQRKHVPVVAIEPKGGKEDRALTVLPVIESGQVWLVEDNEADRAENETLLAQSDVFPKGRLRDLFDSLVQALIYGTSTYTLEGGAYEYLGSSSATNSDDDNDNAETDWR